MAQYTFNGADGKLGSFEGYGKSLLGDQQLGEFGSTPQAAIQQIQSDLATASTMMASGREMLPANWQYPAHQGQPAMAVMNMAHNNLAQEQAKLAQQKQQRQTTSTQQHDTGPSAGEVMTGVGSIIGALANPLANIFATTQQVKLEKERLKRQGQVPQGGGGMDPNMMAMMMAQRNQGGGSNTAIIIGAVVLVLIIVGVVMMKG